jgi:small-conductance mechanosensitive channel
MLVLLPLFVGVVVLYDHRVELLGRTVPARHGVPEHKVLEQALETPITIVAVVVLMILGWTIARDVGRGLGPALFRRMDPATAGTVGFLIRLVTIVVALLLALRVAGVQARTLALGGAFTAVIFGLAAQQTLGNLIAGSVLLSARPFRVGERVRLQGGPLAGQIEGTVSSLGLLYTTFANGDDAVMVPNSVVLSVAVTPLREPEGVDLRARLPLDVRLADVQEMLEDAITVPVRGAPRIELEAVDGNEVVARVLVAPRDASEGSRLAAEVLTALRRYTRTQTDAETADSGRGAAASR